MLILTTWKMLLFQHSVIVTLKKVLSDGPENYKNYDISGYVDWVKAVQGGGGQAAVGLATLREPW